MSIFTCGPVVSIYAQGGANVLYGGVRILPLVTDGPKNLAVGPKQLETRGLLHRVYFSVVNLN